MLQNEATAALREVLVTIYDSSGNRKTGVSGCRIKIRKPGANFVTANASDVTELTGFGGSGGIGGGGDYVFTLSAGEVDTVGMLAYEVSKDDLSIQTMSGSVPIEPALRSVDVGTGAITSSTFAAGAINAAAIAANAIGATQIADAAIDAATFAAGAINAAAIAASAITSSTFAAGAVNAAAIAANAITSSTIAANAIGASQIADAAIDAATFAAGAITSSAIASGAITAATFAANAINAAALATDAATEIATAVLAAAVDGSRTVKGVLSRLQATLAGKATGLLGTTATWFRDDGSTAAVQATQDIIAGTRSAASSQSGD